MLCRFPADIASLWTPSNQSSQTKIPGYPPEVAGANRSEIWRFWGLPEGKAFVAEQAAPSHFDFWFHRDVQYERSHLPQHIWEYWAALRDATLFGPYPSMRPHAHLYESTSPDPIELTNTGCLVLWLSADVYERVHTHLLTDVCTCPHASSPAHLPACKPAQRSACTQVLATTTGRELYSCNEAVLNTKLVAAAKRDGFSVLGFPAFQVCMRTLHKCTREWLCAGNTLSAYQE